MNWHWLYLLYFGYEWPSLKGNGPEALAQTILYAAILTAVYPPLRRWATKEERQARALMHAKLDHVIFHHPDIPPFDPEKSLLCQKCGEPVGSPDGHPKS